MNGAKLGTYSQSASTTATITCTAHGLIASDDVYLDFTSGAASNVDDNLYTVIASGITEDQFRVVLPTSRTVTAENVIIYNNEKFSGVIKLEKINIRLDSKLKTITGSLATRAPITGCTYTHLATSLTVTKTSHGVVAGQIIELDYGLTGATYAQTGTSIVVTKTAHGFLATERVMLDFSTGTAFDDYFTISTATANNFTVTATESIASTSGNVTIGQPFKVDSIAGNVINLTNVVSKSASGSTNIDNKGSLVFLTEDRTMNTNREYIDVDAISLSINGTTPLISMYDFADKPNPWHFRVLTFNTAGTAVSTASCSYTIRGF